MNLDLVLGMSCNNISCLACDRNSGLVAHTASGVLVILDTKTNCQVKYLHLRKNTVSAANFSPDGKYIVTGEMGFRPAVRVWRVKDGQEVATIYGHEFGIKSVLFCPTMDEIVSVGLEHDNEVNVWAWPDKHRLATNKIVDVIRAVAYSDCGKFFVTAGTRHLKFWYPKLTLEDVFQTAVPIVQPLYGRPGILGDCKQHTFIDVACGNGASVGYVYTITKVGGLVVLNACDRHLSSHKSIEDCRGTCLKVQDQILIIGFSSGFIHMFNAITLVHLAALPVPTFFRRTGLNGGGVFTLAFNPCTTLLTTAYKHSSMCVWDLKDAGNVKQKYVAVYHSKAITSLDIFTTIEPGGRTRETLVTVSHDSTVRLWGVIISNSICYDRLSILYTDPTPLGPADYQDQMLDNSGIITAVKVSPDRKHIVTGNKAGNICIYDRDTYEHSLTVLAHNREVTCLAFHCDSFGRTVLVSGSRDRLIHVMDANNEFRLVTTLNIHSSSITSLAVLEIGNSLNMISCAADRSLSICSASSGDTKRPPLFQLKSCATSVSTPADITVDQVTQHIAVGCQDGNIRVFDTAALQERRMFRGCSSEEAQIQKICLDDQGALLLTAASDRSINILNFCTGDILIRASGHTKCVTGLVFVSTGDHVISTSKDGCVFVWRLSEKILMKRKEICHSMEAKTHTVYEDKDGHDTVHAELSRENIKDLLGLDGVTGRSTKSVKESLSDIPTCGKGNGGGCLRFLWELQGLNSCFSAIVDATESTAAVHMNATKPEEATSEVCQNISTPEEETSVPKENTNNTRKRPAPELHGEDFSEYIAPLHRGHGDNDVSVSGGTGPHQQPTCRTSQIRNTAPLGDITATCNSGTKHEGVGNTDTEERMNTFTWFHGKYHVRKVEGFTAKWIDPQDTTPDLVNASKLAKFEGASQPHPLGGISVAGRNLTRHRITSAKRNEEDITFDTNVQNLQRVFVDSNVSKNQDDKGEDDLEETRSPSNIPRRSHSFPLSAQKNEGRNSNPEK